MPTVAITPLSFYSGMRNKIDKANPPPLPQFPNPDFNENFDYWDLLLEWQTPGGKVSNPKANKTILGWPIPAKANEFPTNDLGIKSSGQTSRFPNNSSTPIPNFTFVNTIEQGPNGNCAKIVTAGYVDGGTSAFGPALVSQNPVIGNVGDKIEFIWKAEGYSPGAPGDAYNVLAYIIDKSTGKYHIMVDDNANNEMVSTPWTTASKIIKPGEQGNYYFVFIVGSFDASFGGAIRANLFIDSIRRYKAGTY